MRYLSLLLLTALLTHPALAQTPPPAPLYETRAVWFSTEVGDGQWPERGPGDTPEEQAKDLRARVRAAHALGLNTFVLQVVSSADALYRSTRLPWAALMVGPGEDPTYDPLAEAIDEAHRLGMELHAWFNVFRIGDTGTGDRFAYADDPAHILYDHPEWVRLVDGIPWLDPAEYDARQWVADNILEVVENYDVDAIHLDYIRYPVGGFSTDQDRYYRAPRNFATVDDWRRDNVTQLVMDVATRVRGLKPWVKIGAAPIGNYDWFDGAWPALWAYTDVYQESRRWLNEGWTDYLAPQLYWGFGRDPEPGDDLPSPDFGYLVQEWVQQTAGPVMAGLGAFKDNVASELTVQIDTTRVAGALGQFYYRYDNIIDFNFAGRYDRQALPAPALHRPEAIAPTPPPGLAIRRDTDGQPVLTWAAATGGDTDPVGCYAVFRRSGALPEPTVAEDLVAVVSRNAFTFTDSLTDATAEPYYYRLVALSRLGMASEATPAVSTDQLTFTDADATVPTQLRLGPPYPNPAATSLTLPYELPRAAEVTYTLFDVLGRAVRTGRLGYQSAGPHQAALHVADLPEGVYYATLSADGARKTRHLAVMR